MTAATARCDRCGGAGLRPARSRNALQRILRGATPLERYACDGCGRRGWRLGKLASPAAEAGSSGRPIRAPAARPGRGGRRPSWLGSLPPVGVGLVLGAATAWFLLRVVAGKR